MCQIRYKDAGKPCKGTSDCEGDCILQGGGDPERLPIGTPTLGVCQPLKERFGEFAIVEQGKVASPWIISE